MKSEQSSTMGWSRVKNGKLLAAAVNIASSERPLAKMNTPMRRTEVEDQHQRHGEPPREEVCE